MKTLIDRHAAIDAAVEVLLNSASSTDGVMTMMTQPDFMDWLAETAPPEDYLRMTQEIILEAEQRLGGDLPY